LHPAGRWAQPEEIAQMILFLASADADFVTGATFSIDGGFVAGRALDQRLHSLGSKCDTRRYLSDYLAYLTIAQPLSASCA